MKDHYLFKVKGVFIMGELVSLLKKEKWLTITGIIGLVLGGICQIYIFLTGSMIGAEGDLTKAVSFNVALGIFLITTAIIVPFANFPAKSLITFRWFYVIASLYGYTIETVQHLRGIDPRFTKVGGALDQIFGGIFGLVAITMIVFYVILAKHFFRKDSLNTALLD